ncbi:hypothetical protein [Gemmatimonas aurantiaca]|uniref:hypothetical protein n=1 Tax=Gemmatimonas aurantiaca TaxID=173480 RepID=UPI00301C4425
MSHSRRFSSAFLAVLAFAGTACDSGRASGDAARSATPDGVATDAASGASEGIGAALRGFTRGAASERDLGPDIRVNFRGDSVILTVLASPGDQINALQPPVLEMTDGARHAFVGHGITPDSAYFTGEVSLVLPRTLVPLTATLLTSYCRAGEQLCRSASRPVRIQERAGD